MKKSFIVSLATLPFLTGVATAGQPTALSDAEMDGVAAGFSADAVADALASGKVVATFSATVAQVGPVTSSAGIHVTISFSQALPGVSPLIMQGLQRSIP